MECQAIIEANKGVNMHQLRRLQETCIALVEGLSGVLCRILHVQEAFVVGDQMEQLFD